MAIYEFICHDCKVLWEREAPMSKAPSRSYCPECKKLKDRHWGNIPVIFNGCDFHTVKRNTHNLVYKDKAKAKEVHEGLLDSAKKQAEESNSPYKKYTISKEKFESMKPRRKTKEEQESTKNSQKELKESVYNNSQSYRNLGKR